MLRRWWLVIALLSVVYSATATAVDFPIYMAGCYAKSANGCIKTNTDRTNFADVYFSCAGSGTQEFYCDIDYPVGAGTTWTPTYGVTTTSTGTNICLGVDNLAFIAGDNVTTVALNASPTTSCTTPGTTANCWANPTTNQYAYLTSSASAATIAKASAGSCGAAACDKKHVKLRFYRDNSANCTSNATGAAVQVRVVHVSTN